MDADSAHELRSELGDQLAIKSLKTNLRYVVTCYIVELKTKAQYLVCMVRA